MKLIFDGPRTSAGDFLWYGFRPGVRFWSSGVLGEPGILPYKQQPAGMEPQLNEMANAFWAWFSRDYKLDWKSIGYNDFENYFNQCRLEFHCVESNNPNLLGLKKSGAKLLMTMAVGDDTIPSDNALDYYRRVAERMGGEASLNEYMRFFMSPGGGHTDLVQPGLSFTLADGMIALMNWVEDGIIPEEIPAIQYDFDLNAEILTGKIALYSLDKSNPALGVYETPAYQKLMDVKNNKPEADIIGRFNEESIISDIMADEDGMNVLKGHIGALLDNPMMQNAMGMKIGELKKMIPVPSMQEKVGEAIASLQELSPK